MSRKTYPHPIQNAFIATPARVMAILNLCLTFTLFIWVLFWPFLGEMLNQKRQLFLFQSVIGEGELVARTYSTQPEVMEKLRNHHVRFESLDTHEKSRLMDAYLQLCSSIEDRKASQQFKEGVEGLLLHSSPWFRAWLLLTLIATLMLLKKSQGAPYAIALLPLIVFIWFIESTQNVGSPNPVEALYPTEHYLMSTYGQDLSAKSILQQKEALEIAWERYLEAEWSSLGDAEDGEWHFQLAKLKTALSSKKDRETPSGVLLCLFFIWNASYAFVAYRWRTPAGLKKDDLGASLHLSGVA